MVKKKRRSFTREFKDEAVKLVIEQGYTPSEAAANLGISISTIGKWVRQAQNSESLEVAFPGQGRLNPIDDEIRRLKRELERTRRERDILKKAVGYFAAPHE